MKRYELIVIGAGPAGLSAAIEGAKAGMRVAVFDENARPGGELCSSRSISFSDQRSIRPRSADSASAKCCCRRRKRQA